MTTYVDCNECEGYGYMVVYAKNRFGYEQNFHETCKACGGEKRFPVCPDCEQPIVGEQCDCGVRTALLGFMGRKGR